jgi:hypothetical protein
MMKIDLQKHFKESELVSWGHLRYWAKNPKTLRIAQIDVFLSEDSEIDSISVQHISDDVLGDISGKTLKLSAKWAGPDENSLIIL